MIALKKRLNMRARSSQSRTVRWVARLADTTTPLLAVMLATLERPLRGLRIAASVVYGLLLTALYSFAGVTLVLLSPFLVLLSLAVPVFLIAMLVEAIGMLRQAVLST